MLTAKGMAHPATVAAGSDGGNVFDTSLTSGVTSEEQYGPVQSDPANRDHPGGLRVWGDPYLPHAQSHIWFKFEECFLLQPK